MFARKALRLIIRECDERFYIRSGTVYIIIITRMSFSVSNIIVTLVVPRVYERVRVCS